MHVSSIRIILLLIAQALCAASSCISPARADETAPADTSAFVAYCQDPDHFNTCRLAVVVVNNGTLINVTLNHRHGCLLPIKSGEMRTRSADATKEILSYLETNAASRPPKTKDAILAAIKALWPEKCE